MAKTKSERQYLDIAKRFYKAALRELYRGKKARDDTKIRDAAEKAWNAVVQATNYVFEQANLDVPSSHYDRRKGLIKLERRDGTFREKAFVDRYMAREQRLHEYCFYEGIYDVRLLEEDMKKVQQYIADIEGLYHNRKNSSTKG